MKGPPNLAIRWPCSKPQRQQRKAARGRDASQSSNGRRKSRGICKWGKELVGNFKVANVRLNSKLQEIADHSGALGLAASVTSLIYLLRQLYGDTKGELFSHCLTFKRASTALISLMLSHALIIMRPPRECKERASHGKVIKRDKSVIGFGLQNQEGCLKYRSPTTPI